MNSAAIAVRGPEGTPAQLKPAAGDSVLSVRLADRADVHYAAAALVDLATGDQPRLDVVESEVRLAVADPAASVEAIRRLDAQRVPIAAVKLQQPSLNDVLLSLTGRGA